MASWIVLPSFPMYEICNRYPYSIRERATKVKARKFISDDELPMVEFKVGGSSIPVYFPGIVASMFLPNPNNYGMLGYYDGDSFNTRLENLFWYSYDETTGDTHDRIMAMHHAKKFNNFTPNSHTDKCAVKEPVKDAPAPVVKESRYDDTYELFEKVVFNGVSYPNVYYCELMNKFMFDSGDRFSVMRISHDDQGYGFIEAFDETGKKNIIKFSDYKASRK